MNIINNNPNINKINDRILEINSNKNEFNKNEFQELDLEFQLQDSIVKKQDIFNQVNSNLIQQIEKFYNYDINQLKEIRNNPELQKKFYNAYNATLYNNFYDIYDIIKSDNNEFKYNLEENKLKNITYEDSDVIFYANIKSLNGIIEKIERKRKNKLGKITDIVRGRIDCKDINKAQEIYNKLKEKLNSKNKEILEVDDMINNPRPDYMGRIHLLIKDRETGSTFELQVGSKNITDFIEKAVSIEYDTKENLNRNGTITLESDKLNSNIHDLCYKVTNKILDQNLPYFEKYKNMIPDLKNIKEEYVNIQKEIYEAEKNNQIDNKITGINKRIDNYVNKLQNIFRKIEKNDILKILGNEDNNLKDNRIPEKNKGNFENYSNQNKSTQIDSDGYILMN